MTMEGMPDRNAEQERDFQQVFDATITNTHEAIPTIEYPLPYPKEDFLQYLVREKKVVLHGSSNKDLKKLEPRQANDSAKKFGNKKAVYAVTDPVLPIFYAIQNREILKGMIKTDAIPNHQTGETDYTFEIPASMKEKNPWTSGVIYIFDKKYFRQGTDDAGNPVDEWVSEKAVQPLAKLEVTPEDFRFMNAVQFHNEIAP